MPFDSSIGLAPFVLCCFFFVAIIAQGLGRGGGGSPESNLRGAQTLAAVISGSSTDRLGLVRLGGGGQYCPAVWAGRVALRRLDGLSEDGISRQDSRTDSKNAFLPSSRRNEEAMPKLSGSLTIHLSQFL